MKIYAKKTKCCNNVSNSRNNTHIQHKKMKTLKSINQLLKFTLTRNSKTLKVTITIQYKIAQIQKSTS